ncbi:hypothetical protein Tco_0400458 [Tanacetum coccineum]
MAAPGAGNQIARRVMYDLIDFSEAQTARNLIARLNALIAEMGALEDQGEFFDTLMGLRDDRHVEETKLMGLNDLITQAGEEIKMKEAQLESMVVVPFLMLLAVNEFSRSLVAEYGTSFEHVACFFMYVRDMLPLELTEVTESSRLLDKMKVVFDKTRSEEKAFASLMKDLSLSVRISVSKKRRLVAELKALVERGDPARPLEHMSVIVARDSKLLGELENFWLVLRSVVEDYRLAREINRVTMEVHNVVSARAEFIEELDSLGVRPVPMKLAKFLKEIQLKDHETVA